MALPESFQIALQRAKTERELEQEQILSRVGDTIRQGVPLLSGVVAGALSRSPILGIGTAFIADKLQQRNEEKREQRRASRLEMRQRREAAKILSAQNEDMSFRDAMRLIEEKAVEKQQELNRQREEQLLDQFDVNNLQRQVIEQESEQVGEPVQAQDQVISSTLEDTFMRIDENITGILDLLVEKFGTDEQRAERAEARQAFLDARRREELAEIARNVLPRRDEGEPERSPEEDSGPSFLSRVGGFLANLLTSKFVLLPVAAGLALIFAKPLGELYEKYFGPNGKFRPELDAIGDAITKRIDQAESFLKEKLEELVDYFIQDFPPLLRQAIKEGLLGSDDPELDAERTRQALKSPFRFFTPSGVSLPGLPGGQPQRLTPMQQVSQQVRDMLASSRTPPTLGTLPQSPTPSGQRDFRFFNVAPEDRIAPTQQRPAFSGILDDVFTILRTATGGLGLLLVSPKVGEGSDIVPENQVFDFSEFAPKEPADRLDPRVIDQINNLGANLNTVSGAQTAFNFSPIIAPQTTSSTTVNQSKTTNLNGSAINPYSAETKFAGTNRSFA